MEEGIVKLKWEWMGEEMDKKKRKSSSLSDLAVDVALDELLNDEEKSQMREKEQLEEAKMRMTYDVEDKTSNFSKKRVTDFKGNTRVCLPTKSKNFEREAVLEMMRVELLAEYGKYEATTNGDGGGSNLSPAERRGLKSLKKRVEEGDLVILPTDKSGRFACMRRSVYEAAGMKHCRKDEEVTQERIKVTQHELNGHSSMLTKIFKLGQTWDQVDRVRETVINRSMAICPMFLLYKDHKGWKWGDGGSPPTRPIVSGNKGMNMHLSEMISEVVEPVADVYKHGFEAISTEDLLANFMMVDKMYEGWSPTKWWDGLTDESGMYEACGVCVGKEEYEYDEENPEFCKCGARETAFYSTVPTESELLSTVPTDEDDQSWGTRRVTTNFLRSKRLEDWRKEHNWKPEVIIDSKDALPEMLQDYSLPVEIIGCDVEALYSLSIPRLRSSNKHSA